MPNTPAPSPGLVTTVTPQPQSGAPLPQSVTIVPSARGAEKKRILSLSYFPYSSRACARDSGDTSDVGHLEDHSPPRAVLTPRAVNARPHHEGIEHR
jgi:hypothetical protein